jgi:hypothetical protein
MAGGCGGVEFAIGNADFWGHAKIPDRKLGGVRGTFVATVGYLCVPNTALELSIKGLLDALVGLLKDKPRLARRTSVRVFDDNAALRDYRRHTGARVVRIIGTRHAQGTTEFCACLVGGVIAETPLDRSQTQESIGSLVETTGAVETGVTERVGEVAVGDRQGGQPGTASVPGGIEGGGALQAKSHRNHPE